MSLQNPEFFCFLQFLLEQCFILIFYDGLNKCKKEYMVTTEFCLKILYQVLKKA